MQRCLLGEGAIEAAPQPESIKAWSRGREDEPGGEGERGEIGLWEMKGALQLPGVWISLLDPLCLQTARRKKRNEAKKGIKLSGGESGGAVAQHEILTEGRLPLAALELTSRGPLEGLGSNPATVE